MRTKRTSNVTREQIIAKSVHIDTGDREREQYVGINGHDELVMCFHKIIAGIDEWGAITGLGGDEVNNRVLQCMDLDVLLDAYCPGVDQCDVESKSYDYCVPRAFGNEVILNYNNKFVTSSQFDAILGNKIGTFLSNYKKTGSVEAAMMLSMQSSTKKYEFVFDIFGNVILIDLDKYMNK